MTKPQRPKPGSLEELEARNREVGVIGAPLGYFARGPHWLAIGHMRDTIAQAQADADEMEAILRQCPNFAGLQACMSVRTPDLMGGA